jgi:hypothetical protein
MGPKDETRLTSTNSTPPLAGPISHFDGRAADAGPAARGRARLGQSY